jgi:phosphoacetylglucosamine mutase
MSWKESLSAQLAIHPKPDVTFTYGTAGFRTKASVLDYVNFTVGILASLRSKYLASQFVGVMITASHNPPPDNGVKVVDPMGSMLELTWEARATRLANASHAELPSEIEHIAAELGIDLETTHARVAVARDSRESLPRLAQALLDGLLVLPHTEVRNFGLFTTPQLHYVTRCLNDPLFGDPTAKGYYLKLANAYKKITASSASRADITIDAANGVGAPVTQEFFSHHLNDALTFRLINTDYEAPDLLNWECGADFVKTNQKLPPSVSNAVKNKLYALYDGDADRLICYYVTDDAQFRLLDGDKQATLLALFFQRVFARLPQLGHRLRIGVVQTAYANGASTQYIESALKLPVTCTATGVKHLHHAALEYDVGVYFEANGHGTVVFSAAAERAIFAYTPATAEEAQLVEVLREFTRLINQTVGDAISDLLAVLAVLSFLGLSPAEWDAQYHDLPNRLTKVLVPDRLIFKTTNAERTLVEPKGLQHQIDAAVAQFSRGRAFVRASGTEDAVRVYAEAATAEEADALSRAVLQLVT